MERPATKSGPATAVAATLGIEITSRRMSRQRDEGTFVSHSKAIGLTSPGGPQSLSVVSRNVREPGVGEVRIKVAAATVNPIDVAFSAIGLSNFVKDVPPPWVLGLEAAGHIEAVGEGVDRLRVGQAVMAVVTMFRPEGGAHADLVVASADSVVPIPDGATIEQAATLPMNGLTALLAVETLNLSAGGTVAVTGAAGLVGSYAVAIAQKRGLRVIGDAAPQDEALVKGFGADLVLPRGESFPDDVKAHTDGGVDGLIDAAALGRGAFSALRDGGTLAMLRSTDDVGEPERGIVISRVLHASVAARTDWLDQLRAMASDGTLALRVAGTYPPDQAAAAFGAMQAGGLRGRALLVF